MRVNIWVLCMVIAGCFLATALFAQESIQWQPTLDIAKRVAGQSGRLVLVHFWSPSCEPCRAMERDVFPSRDVAMAMNADYVPVKLNADHFPATARQFGVSALPTDVIITPQGQLVEKHVGAVAPEKYVAMLRRAAGTKQQIYLAGSPAAVPSGQPVSNAPGSPPGPPNVYAGYPNMGQLGGAPAAAQHGNPPPAFSYGNQLSIPGNVPSNQNAAVPPSNYYTQPEGSPIGSRQESPPPFTPSGPIAGQPIAGESAMLPTGTPTIQTPPRIEPHTPPQVAAGNPPMGLDGYCPVQLSENERWVKGNPRWGLIHRGRTYLFAGPEEQSRFYADPDRYAPVYSGNDIVAIVESGQQIAGRREHGAWFDGRVYLFASEDSYSRFQADPFRYVQAMQQIAATSANARANTSGYPGLR